jgi:hypothetical protein
MSTMGSNVAQSVAGAQQAQHAAAPRPTRTDAAKQRRAVRTGDQVELSTELIDAVHDPSNATDEQPRQQRHPSTAPGDEKDAPPHVDVQA